MSYYVFFKYCPKKLRILSVFTLKTKENVLISYKDKKTCKTSRYLDAYENASYIFKL